MKIRELAIDFSFCLDPKRNKKVKAVHLSLENYTPFHCITPTRKTPLTDSFTKNPMQCSNRGSATLHTVLFSYAS